MAFQHNVEMPGLQDAILYLHLQTTKGQYSTTLLVRTIKLTLNTHKKNRIKTVQASGLGPGPSGQGRVAEAWQDNYIMISEKKQ